MFSFFAVSSCSNTFSRNLFRIYFKRMSDELIEIDGSVMEGGGQILRMSLALSALLRKPIKVYNIRAGRSKPGLRPQHLAGVNLMRDITDGQLTGGYEGSTEITFRPGKISGGDYYANTGTAGSIMLLFQVSFPCLLFADKPSELQLRGGTNAEFAPQIDHVLMVFKPIVEQMGAKFSCTILTRGYFPKGGGEVFIKVEPRVNYLKPIEILQPGSVVQMEGKSFVAGALPVKMAHDMADAASRCLRGSFPNATLKVNRLKESASVGNGSGIVLMAKTDTGCLMGGSALGRRGVETREVGEKAANEIIEDVASNACVDRYVQDQLIIFMALAKGKSRVCTGAPTLHTKTAIFVAEMLTRAKFTIHQEELSNSSVIECEGIAYVPPVCTVSL